MTDPLPERVDTEYDPADIREAIAECVERGTIVEADGSYQLPDA